MANLNWKAIGIIAAVVVGAIFVVKFVGGKVSGLIETSNTRVSVYSFLVTGTMAAVFILLLKFLTAKFPVPGLTEAAHAI